MAQIVGENKLMRVHVRGFEYKGEETDGRREPPRALVSSRTEMTLRRVQVGMGLIWGVRWGPIHTPCWALGSEYSVT